MSVKGSARLRNSLIGLNLALAHAKSVQLEIYFFLLFMLEYRVI